MTTKQRKIFLEAVELFEGDFKDDIMPHEFGRRIAEYIKSKSKCGQRGWYAEEAVFSALCYLDYNSIAGEGDLETWAEDCIASDWLLAIYAAGRRAGMRESADRYTKARRKKAGKGAKR